MRFDQNFSYRFEIFLKNNLYDFSMVCGLELEKMTAFSQSEHNVFHAKFRCCGDRFITLKFIVLGADTGRFYISFGAHETKMFVVNIYNRSADLLGLPTDRKIFV